MAPNIKEKGFCIIKLSRPPPTNIETQLVRQGFSDKFTVSIDLVSEWAVVRRKLQEMKADPQTTHIEYFADQIPVHIAYIRNSIEAILASSDSKRRWSTARLDKSLKALRKLGKKAIKNEQVTYLWWLEFNMNLASIMSGRYFTPQPNSPRGGMGWGMDQIRQHSLYEFPENIWIPTIKGEDIGIIAFRKARENGVYPLGLINTPKKIIDGQERTAYHGLLHDIGHANLTANKTVNTAFDKRLGKSIETLPPEKRKKAEMVYYLMTHERSTTQIMLFNYITPQTMRTAVIRHLDHDNGGLSSFLRLPDNPDQRQKKIEDFVDAFMKAYNRAQQYQ